MKRVFFGIMGTAVSLSMLLAACRTPEATTPTATGPATTVPPAATTPAATTPRSTTPTPTTPTGETPQYGGVLKVGTGATPRTLAAADEVIKNFFDQALYDSLLQWDDKGELAPGLATEWTIGADNKSITLVLRKGVKFHDGSDFNAEAVKFNIENRKRNRPGDYNTITSMDIVDEQTIRFNLSTFTNTLFADLTFLAGQMYSPTAYKLWGADDSRWHPTGTGPFKFVRYDMGTLLKLVRFDGYWRKGKPYLDGFEHHIITDSTTREQSLRAGEIHLSEGLPARSVANMSKEGWPLITGDVEVYNEFMIDTANADTPFGNKKVREAVEHAIDREAVAKGLGHGRMRPLYQMAPDTTYAYLPDLPKRQYDPVKAKQLLTEAGYPKGFKTSFVTLFADSDPLVAARGYLKEIGIEGDVEIVQFGAYYNYTRQGWKNKLIYRAFRVPPDWLVYMNSMVAEDAGENVSMTRPPGFQDLLTKAATAPDMAGKKAASQQVVKMMYDEAMAIPLWGTEAAQVISKNVRNFEYHLAFGFGKSVRGMWGPSDVWLSK